MSSKKYVVLDVTFQDGGRGFSQFVLPDEKSQYKKEMKWLQFEKKQFDKGQSKIQLKWTSKTYSEDEVVVLDDVIRWWHPSHERTEFSMRTPEEKDIVKLCEEYEKDLDEVHKNLMDIEI